MAEHWGFQPLSGRRHCCSVAKSCWTLWDFMDCSTPGFSVLHYLSEFAQTHVHWVSDAIQPSRPFQPPSLPALNLSQHQSLFQWVWLFVSGGQSIGASASTSVLPMNIQGWFPLGLTGLISLLSKELFGKLMQALHLFSRKVIRYHETWDTNAKPRVWAFAKKS